MNPPSAGVRINQYRMETCPLVDKGTGKCLSGQEMGRLVFEEEEPLLGDVEVRATFDHGPQV